MPNCWSDDKARGCGGAFGCRIVTVLQYLIPRLHFKKNIEENYSFYCKYF
jgi:hypothetical protein